MLLRVFGVFQSAAETLLGFALFGLALLLTFIIADALSDAFRSWRIARKAGRAQSAPAPAPDVIPIRTARPADGARHTAGV